MPRLTSSRLSCQLGARAQASGADRRSQASRLPSESCACRPSSLRSSLRRSAQMESTPMPSGHALPPGPPAAAAGQADLLARRDQIDLVAAQQQVVGNSGDRPAPRISAALAGDGGTGGRNRTRVVDRNIASAASPATGTWIVCAPRPVPDRDMRPVHCRSTPIRRIGAGDAGMDANLGVLGHGTGVAGRLSAFLLAAKPVDSSGLE